MKIPVNGLCESAGKTTAAIALYEWFKDIGEARAIKPFAANDYWHDHSTVMEGIEEGKLYEEDAKQLSELVRVREEAVNPVQRLWAPASFIGRGAGIGGQDRSIILDRIECEDGLCLAVNSHVDAFDKLQPLFEKSEEVYQFSDSSDLNEITNNMHMPVIRRKLREVLGTGFLILESYSDAAMLVSMEFDSVVTVEPGRALISEGERFCEAYSFVSDK